MNLLQVAIPVEDKLTSFEPDNGFVLTDWVLRLGWPCFVLEPLLRTCKWDSHSLSLWFEWRTVILVVHLWHQRSRRRGSQWWAHGRLICPIIGLSKSIAWRDSLCWLSFLDWISQIRSRSIVCRRTVDYIWLDLTWLEDKQKELASTYKSWS